MSRDEIELQEREWNRRSDTAEAAAVAAYERLLQLAEAGFSGQARTVAQFVAATFDGQSFGFDLFDLRTVDMSIADDMLVCLDALRWGKADLYKLVPDGYSRIVSMCKVRGLR